MRFLIGVDILKKPLSFFIAIIIITAIFFAVKITTSKDPAIFSTDETESEAQTIPISQEIRAVWISYFELTVMNDSDKSEKVFRQKARTMIENCADNKMNTVYLHVRPSSDAFYKSEIYPFSMYLTGTEGKDPGYDPLEIFCEYGKEYGVDIHAWINPFRVCSVSNLSTRSQKNPAVQIMNDNDVSNDDMVITVGSGIYYNPSLPEVHKLVTDGVREVLQNYPVKGIHIDDYFYPSTDASLDSSAYAEYTANGGELSLSNWRRESMNSFVTSMYRTVKSFGDDKIFSISPEADISDNYNENFADVQKWATENGYCDYLIPQLYYGFEHDKYPFRQTADAWVSMEKNAVVPIVFGLSIYKSGTEDVYAGSGGNEWLENDDIISSQIEYVRTLPHYGGFALYSYSYAFGENLNDNSKKEITLVINML